MKTFKLLSGLALLCAASPLHAAPNCAIKLKGDDRMQFDLKTATVSASCPKITVELTHTGKMAAQVMGHNVVISQAADMNAINAAGMKAGAAPATWPRATPRPSPPPRSSAVARARRPASPAASSRPAATTRSSARSRATRES